MQGFLGVVAASPADVSCAKIFQVNKERFFQNTSWYCRQYLQDLLMTKSSVDEPLLGKMFVESKIR